MPPSSDLLTQVLLAEQAKTQQQNPWVQSAAMLNKTPAPMNPSGNIGANIGAALIQGLIGGGMQAYGQSTLDADMAQKGQELLGILQGNQSNDQGMINALQQSETWKPYAGYVALDQFRRNQDIADEDRKMRQALGQAYINKNMIELPAQREMEGIRQENRMNVADYKDQLKVQGENRRWDRASGQRAESLRKEFTALKPVAKLQETLPIVHSLVQGLGKSDRGSALDFVYGIAKIYDPESGVREGEQVMVRQTGQLPGWVYDSWRYVTGGGVLSPTLRMELLSNAMRRYDAYRGMATKQKQAFEVLAGRNGADPTMVTSTFPSGALSGAEYLKAAQLIMNGQMSKEDQKALGFLVE
jgi:hypothetical protein